MDGPEVQGIPSNLGGAPPRGGFEFSPLDNTDLGLRFSPQLWSATKENMMTRQQAEVNNNRNISEHTFGFASDLPVSREMDDIVSCVENLRRILLTLGISEHRLLSLAEDLMGPSETHGDRHLAFSTDLSVVSPPQAVPEPFVPHEIVSNHLCPNGHDLFWFNDFVCVVCDVCEDTFFSGAAVSGCRLCDFDFCAHCLSFLTSTETVSSGSVKVGVLPGSPICHSGFPSSGGTSVSDVGSFPNPCVGAVRRCGEP